MKRRRLLTPLMILTLVMLAGCAPTGGIDVDPDLDVLGAKRVAQDMELSFAEFVPPAEVASVDQAEESGLLSCGTDRAFQWAGHTNVHLIGPSETAAIMDAVVAAYVDKTGYTAIRETLDDGVPSVQVRGPHGSVYMMALSVDRTYIQILSFSPCFRLADDLHPRDTY